MIIEFTFDINFKYNNHNLEYYINVDVVYEKIFISDHFVNYLVKYSLEIHHFKYHYIIESIIILFLIRIKRMELYYK